MQKKTTMTDIARALGVSQTLVSFVLSGKNDMGISPDTKKKVLQTAHKMGYLSNAASKMLKSGRSGCVSLLFGSERDARSMDFALVGSITGALDEYGYSLIIPGVPGRTDIAACKELFSDKRSDGFIVCGDA